MRSRLKRTLESMTRVLPAIGFGRPAGPPVEPPGVTEAAERPESRRPPTEQRHGLASDDQEHGASHRR